MEIIKSKAIVSEANVKGVSATHLINKEHVRVTKLMLEPGDIVPEHDVPVEVFFYVISGRGSIQIGNERTVVEAEDLVTCPKDTKMALWADQDDSFVVMNVKTPNF